MTLEVEQIIDGYLILEKIGSGGNGVVYKAQSERDESIVAIKIPLNSRIKKDPHLADSFKREISAVNRLEHPYIAKSFGAGIHKTEENDQVESIPYFAMELVEGVPLSEFADISIRSIVTLMAKVADSIAYAHRQRVIHRDLKPSNIFVDSSDNPRILDFGIAHLMDEITPSSSVFEGTPTYAAPEQFRGETADERTDIWTLGAILFELLTKQPPFVPENWQALSEMQKIFAIQEMVLKKRTPCPSKINPNVDRFLKQICKKALSKDPEKRYQSAEDFAADLKQWGRANRDWAAEKTRQFYFFACFLPGKLKQMALEKAFYYLERALSYETATTPIKQLLLKLFELQNFPPMTVVEMPLPDDLLYEEWEKLSAKIHKSVSLQDNITIPVTQAFFGIGIEEMVPHQILLLYQKPKGKSVLDQLGQIPTEDIMEIVRGLTKTIAHAKQLGLQPGLPKVQEIFVNPAQFIGRDWLFGEQEVGLIPLIELIYQIATGTTLDLERPLWEKVPEKFRDVLKWSLVPMSSINTGQDLLDALERKQQAYKILENGILDRPFLFPPGEYYIQRDLVIETNGHLQLVGGTTLKFAADVQIQCSGKITATGNWDEKQHRGDICFIPSASKKGWGGVHYTSDTPLDFTQTFSGCTLEGGFGSSEENGLVCGGLFYIEAGNIKITQSCLKDNKVEGSGGAICISGNQSNPITVEIEESIFSGNQAHRHGGAFYIQNHGQVTIQNCRFENNRTGEEGGALYLRGADSSHSLRAEITKSTFVENRAQMSGGALYSGFYSAIEIEKCQYDSNISDDSGGAIAAMGKGDIFSSLSLSSSKFIANRCQNRGGAISIKKNIEIICANSRFDNNSSARDSGGAFAMDGKGGSKNSTAIFNDVLFSENRCRVDGGAINANVYSHITCSNCRFEGNYTEDNSGGAIVIVGENDNYSEGIFHHCAFKRNRCRLDGGAINANLYTKTIFENCRFKNNTAEDSGGAIEVAGEEGEKASEANFKEVIFLNNRCKISGGAINAVDYTRVGIEQCQFENNRSEEEAGAICFKGADGGKYSEILLRNTQFIENRSKFSGGAMIVHMFTRAKFTNCLFSENHAETKNAGAVHIAGKRAKNCTEVSFHQVQFLENQCKADGGAINLGFYSLTVLDDVKFERNAAGNSGGAIGVSGKKDDGPTKITVRKGIFLENQCNVDGGAIAAGPHTQMILSESHFRGNRANANCGAIGVIGKPNSEPSKAKFQKVIFTENYAKGDGGAIAAGIKSRLIFDECFFEGNYADGSCGALGIAGKDSENLSDATFSQVTFKNNHASIDGGAMVIGGYSRIKFVDSMFEQNYADQKTGGAILILGGDSQNPTICNFKHVQFIKNYCAVDGGAINANIYSHLIFESCLFQENFVKQKNGGAVVLLGKDNKGYTEATFRKVDFIRNQCKVSGGAVNANDYTRSLFSECSFESNSALEKNGGAVLILGDNSQDPSDAKFQDVKFINNYCKGSGGGVNANVYTITHFEGCSLQSNVADENGGGIFVRGLRRVPNKATIKGCHFSGNVAGNIGPDVALHAVKGVSEMSLIEENTIELPASNPEETPKKVEAEPPKNSPQGQIMRRKRPSMRKSGKNPSST